MDEVVVVGGGLAGLVTARRLARAGTEVTLFERRGEVGGRVRTIERDGFTLDRGFQVLFTAYPAVRHELDLDALDLRSFEPGATIARPGSRSVLSDPFREPRLALATLRNPEVEASDLLGLLALRRSLRRRSPDDLLPGPDRSVERYLAERGFSRAFIDHFAAPFYGGITLDRSLSTAAGVFEYTFKMLVEGDVAVPAAGMGAIPEQLADSAREAGVRIETDATVSGVEPTGDGAVAVDAGGETVAADAAVVATDPPTAWSLTGVDAIPTDGRGCVTQYCSLPAEVDLGTGARIVLNAADAAPNHVAPMSAVAPERAPDGTQLLAATFLGVPDVDDGALAERTRRALAAWYPGGRLDDLAVVHTERVQFAQFEQPPGVHARLPSADAPEGQVYLAGDYTRWSSIQGALESGGVAASAVLDGLA